MGIWPDNWPPVRCFMGLQTQWRLGPAGGLMGFEYAAIPVVMAMYGIEKDDEQVTFEGIQTMEAAVLKAYRAKQ